MEESDLFLRFGSALAIGLLVGLQREYAQSERQEILFAGVRTFPLLALAGAAAAFLSDLIANPLPLVAVILGMCALMSIAYYANTRLGRHGMTTETSALLTILVGALCYHAYYTIAAALGVVITALLSLKVEMHGFAKRLTRQDLFAVLKFAVITLIILPVLPNKNYGPPPIDVLNPYRIWLMVVLISGISFLGYVLIKTLGPKQGIGLSGLLGGLVSSTAVTLSFTQRSREQPSLANPLALAITISWTTMFLRVLLVIAILNWSLASLLWLPLLASAVAGTLYCVYLFYKQRTDEIGNVEFSNPFELKPALRFGLIYAVILVISKGAQALLGDAGVYVSSLVAGLADLNAISLSIAELSAGGFPVALPVAARALVLAAVANTAVKGGIVVTMGAPSLRRALWPSMLIMSLVAITVVLYVT